MTNLIVTVDTEEEGLWGGEYRRTGNTVENIRGVPRFQELCDRWGIQPVYLVDAPVVDSDDAVGTLRPIHDDGRCEIGTHVHPWCNLPFEEEINEVNSYLSNLPESLQRRKIEWLTDRIESRFGHRPTSFRAGRYGLDIVGARILADLGYVVDSSVIPFTDYSPNGPDFGEASYDPYFVGDCFLEGTSNSSGLLEVPVTVGFNRVDFRRADMLRRIAGRTPLRQMRCVGILDRLGVVQRIKLSPEQASAEQMKRLLSVRVRQGAPCVVLMLHSSSLVTTLSPYVPNHRALEQLYETLNQVFSYAIGDLMLTGATLTTFGNKLQDESRNTVTI